MNLKLSKLNDDQYVLKIDKSRIFNFKRKKEISSLWLANENEWRKKETTLTV